jgi:hypothetical protein
MIKLDEIYVNRTRIYLVPALLNQFNPVTQQEFRILRPLMWGTFDLEYLHAKKVPELKYKLFVLVKYDTKARKIIVKKLKEHLLFEDAYPMSFNDQKHLFLVFRIPRSIHKSYDAFVAGKFSEMFTESQLRKLGITEFEGKKENPVYAILTKKKHFANVFKAKLEEYYDTVIDDEPDEFDSFYVPPTHEGFNSPNYGPVPPV